MDMDIVRSFRLANMNLHSDVRLRIDCTRTANHSTTFIRLSPSKSHVHMLSQLPPRSACRLHRLCASPEEEMSAPLVFHTENGNDGTTSIGTLDTCNDSDSDSDTVLRPPTPPATKQEFATFPIPLSAPILVVALLALGNVGLILLVSRL